MTSSEDNSPLEQTDSERMGSQRLLSKGIRRPRMDLKQLRNLLARRYGSLHDFSCVVARWCDIGRATGVSPDTIRTAVQRYHNNGNRFIPTNGKTCAVGRPRVIPESLEAELTSRETLYKMRFLSTKRRRELIRREHGVQLGKNTLARIYHRNGVRYLQAKKVKRVGPAAAERIEVERSAFARKLDGLQRLDGDQIIYMDQTTFMIWPKPTRTWQLATSTIAAPENKKYLSAVTLFGAVGKCLNGGHLYMQAPSTDTESVKKFLVKLAASLRNPYGRRPYLVLDNHPAHRSQRLRDELSRFTACFQPAYSSPFNC